MADRADRRSLEDLLVVGASPSAEAARITSAAARLLALEEVERRLLDLAVRETDDVAARWLEGCADTAWRDGLALAREHDLDKEDWDHEDA
jgi:hypothetical protein